MANNTDDTWYEVSKVIASGASENANFGNAVSLFGSIAMISAPNNDGSGEYIDFAYHNYTYINVHVNFRRRLLLYYP